MHDVPRFTTTNRPGAVDEIPTAWAGGDRVVVPGVGVGRLVQDGPPRVVEIPLGAPVATVLTVTDESGPGRAIILADPDVEPGQLASLIDAGELLDAEAHAVRRVPRPRVPRQRTRPSFARGVGYTVTAWLAGVAAAIAAGALGADTSKVIDADGPRVSAEAVTALPAAV
ncbi:hypothetical protein [Pseudonocardia sp. McavD-2-B]|uniref:hypothetical protein n=1 Tax=Pseudonocardia sp. McavD-2-B TaxID=2954499 RepID=UPI002096A27E|nr:hypothetical protein [Pseudonocardia sp. McavD-2-B]MCO7192294.1 hypothetical protein [Pseudonocardia sp. McavD-2-B]